MPLGEEIGAGAKIVIQITLKERLVADPAFRLGLLSEAIDLPLSGEVTTGKQVLRAFINETTGFQARSEEVGIPAKSLPRTMSAQGNPRADNLFSIIQGLQALIGIQLSVRAAA